MKKEEIHCASRPPIHDSHQIQITAFLAKQVASIWNGRDIMISTIPFVPKIQVTPAPPYSPERGSIEGEMAVLLAATGCRSFFPLSEAEDGERVQACRNYPEL
jgi:hypothetical protein